MPAIPEAMQRERYADECRAAGVLDQYNDLLDLGNSPGFAAMLALQEPPGTRNTDRAFCDGQRRKMENMSPLVRGMLQADAKKAGIDTRGKFYVGGLGKSTDPKAWVTSSDDVLTVCKAKNYECDGVLRHKATVKEVQPKSKGVAPDIVNLLARQAISKDPALRERVKNNKRALGELKESIADKHGRKKTGPSSNRLLRSLKSSRA